MDKSSKLLIIGAVFFALATDGVWRSEEGGFTFGLDGAAGYVANLVVVELAFFLGISALLWRTWLALASRWGAAYRGEVNKLLNRLPAARNPRWRAIVSHGKLIGEWWDQYKTNPHLWRPEACARSTIRRLYYEYELEGPQPWTKDQVSEITGWHID